MTAPDPWIQPELRALRRHLLTVIAMLLVGCGVLGFGWWNAEADKDAMLTLFTDVATLVEQAEFVVDTLKAALADENQRVLLLGPRAILRAKP